jgi:hypothetical protein
MDDDPILTDEVLASNSFFLVHFAAHDFCQKFDFSNCVLRALPVLTANIMDVITGQRAIASLRQFLLEFKETFPNSPRFQDRLDEMVYRLGSEQDPAKYLWEVASDLTLLSHELYSFTQSSLSLIQRSDERLQTKLSETIPDYRRILEERKPPTSKEPHPISFALSDPKVLKAYCTYIHAQRTQLKKCPCCGLGTTRFALPCSHPAKCTNCMSETGDDLPEDKCSVTDCQAAITKVITIPWPE